MSTEEPIAPVIVVGAGPTRGCLQHRQPPQVRRVPGRQNNHALTARVR
jgi:hypothetical protein